MKVTSKSARLFLLGLLLLLDANAFTNHVPTIAARLPLSHENNFNNIKPSSPLKTNHRCQNHNGRGILSTTTALSAIPTVSNFAVAAFLPTCLGFWRTGYAVSYGYGGAMLASGLLQLIVSGAETTLSTIHAAIYAFYGIRLCGFLLNREIKLPVEIHQMKRRDASLLDRLKRLPVIVGSSVLYFCMAAAPMRILATQKKNPPNVVQLATLTMGAFGFLLAAIGDWYKSKVKARDGPETLVTSGPFRYLRHPNYTGEMIGWTCQCLLAPLLSGNPSRAMIPWWVSSVIGWVGMVLGVLMVDATAALERKQKEKYGGTPEYEEWTKTSWSGPMF